MKGWFSENPLRRMFCSLILSFLPVFLLVVNVHAAGGGGEIDAKAQMKDFGWRVVNFVILVGLLYWLVAKKIKTFFAGRREEIRSALAEAEAKKAEAEKQFAEHSAKLDRAMEEIKNIADMIRAQGLMEKEKIIEEAKKAAEKIKEDAQARMEQEFKAAVNQLRIEAVRLSVQMAEEILKKNITLEHHEYMVKDYLDKVVKKH